MIEVQTTLERVEPEQDVQRAERARVDPELASFSYSVAHDLRAPLRAIDGFSRILLEEHADQLDEEGSRLLGIVVDNIARMGALLDGVLAFSRVARAPLVLHDVDMDQLVRSVVDELLGSGFHARVDLAIEPLGTTRGDPVTMRQVWMNLCQNALKFSRDRPVPRIHINRRSRAHEVVYSISDNGAGFDPAAGSKLFGVFQRLHPEAAFEGIGIGLALVERIVDRHGGRVWAESQVDQGATFFFTLPRDNRSTPGQRT